MDYNDPFIEITSRLDKSRKKVSHKPTIPKPFVTITYPAGHPSVAMGFEVETLRHSVFCYEHTLPETNSKFALESHGWLSGRRGAASCLGAILAYFPSVFAVSFREGKCQNCHLRRGFILSHMFKSTSSMHG